MKMTITTSEKKTAIAALHYKQALFEKLLLFCITLCKEVSVDRVLGKKVFLEGL